MGSSGNGIGPNYDLFLQESWGPGSGITGCPWLLTGASNVVVGTNPPYSISDFFAVYPQFGGTPQLISGVITQGSATITGISSTAGILPGQPVCPVIPLLNGQLAAGSFPYGTTVLSVDDQNTVTLSLEATNNGDSFAVYTSSFVPILVLNLYIALATSSVIQARWREIWPLGMANYIAHFATLFLRSSGDTFSSPGQVAAAGLARGIQVSKSAGGVSLGIQPSTSGGGLADWGQWTETSFGVQFATFARTIGCGPMWIY